MDKLSLSIRLLLFWPIAFACISRGVTILPFLQHSEKVPYVFHSLPGGEYIFCVLWITSGVLLMVSAFIGHVNIIHPKNHFASILLADLAILLTTSMLLVWGISYYLSWIFGQLGLEPTNQDYTAGRNYLPWAIVMFTGWRIWFWFRTRDKANIQNSE